MIGRSYRGEPFPDTRPIEAFGHPILIDIVDGGWRVLDLVVDPPGTPSQQSWQRLAE